MLPTVETRAAQHQAETQPKDDETPVSTELVRASSTLQIQPYVPSDPIDAIECVHPCSDEVSPPPNFLDWDTFDEATLRPRKNIRRSRLDMILSPLRSVNAGVGYVSVEGLGGIIESAHGVFRSVRRLDFMESERTIYLLSQHQHQHQHQHQEHPNNPAPNALRPRDLERYENELFDLSKYNGACDYLTAVAWTEESLAGSITLYRVLCDAETGGAVGLRPVAAMRDVPSPVLVRMRTDERIRRKAVLTLIDADDRTFDWKANPARGPRYVRLGGTGAPPGPSPRSKSRSRSRQPAGRLAEGDGVCATIPQFVALLHARRSILERVRSSRITTARTEEGSVKPAVFLSVPPRSSPHVGNAVHVAVLAPNDAAWAEEEIIWTDQMGLTEFRQRAYWDAIERASPRARERVRSRSRSRVWSGDGPGYAGQKRRSGSQARGRSASHNR